MTVLLVAGLFLFFVLDIPIAFSMLLTSILYIVIDGNIPLISVAQRFAVGTDNYLLLTIPFFFLAAELMNTGGIMIRLVHLAEAMVGHIRGGLGQANVVASMLFAGMSGSAVADAAGLGRLELEVMQKGGYDADFSTAITAASATIGPVIPPSIPLVIYGGIAGVSVAKLFLAGVVPGALMGLFLMIAVYVFSLRRNYPLLAWVGVVNLLVQLMGSILVLLLPLIIVVGILSGAFTPTEASVVAAVYAFIIGKFVLREITWKQFGGILIKVGADTARLMLILAAGSLFAWIMAREGVPQALAAWFLSVSKEPWCILLMINILLLVLGCFMEPISVMIILVPILMPIITMVGIDPVHFGVVVTLNLMIGLITPPVGMVMFVMVGITGISIHRFTRAIVPFLVALLTVLALITYVPILTLAFPGWILG